MYEDTVKRLRNCAIEAAPCKTCSMIEDGSCTSTLMKEAADAIEYLSKLNKEIAKRQLKLLMNQLRWVSVTLELPDAGKEVYVTLWLLYASQTPPLSSRQRSLCARTSGMMNMQRQKV